MGEKGLKTNEINTILTNYQDYFRRRLKRKLPKNYDLPFKVTEDDFLQEVLINMWELLSSRYDSKLGTINTFVTSHIDMCIKHVIAPSATLMPGLQRFRVLNSQ